MWELFSILWLWLGGNLHSFKGDFVNKIITIVYRPQLAEITATANINPANQAQSNLLANLQKQGYSARSHGLWIQSQNGELLAQHQATTPIPAASLTKIATSLVAIHEWGLYHRFTTKFRTNGQIVGDTLQGDLIIDGGIDPLFVWEDGIIVGNRLNQLGIKKIAGTIILKSKFAMNFEQDSKKVIEFLTMAVNSNSWNSDIEQQYRNLPANTPKPNVVFIKASTNQTKQDSELFSYQSIPLWQIIKNMNVYSNNQISEILAMQLGGAQKLSQTAAELSGVPPAEIKLINGSGLGKANQISPRAVVAMMIKLQNMVQDMGFSIADLLPVAGCRCGTIVYRELPKGAIIKTGTLDDVSSLAGVIQTKEKGIIWFAILNQGRGELSIFHKVQDDLLNSLDKEWQGNYYYFERSWERFQRNTSAN